MQNIDIHWPSVTFVTLVKSYLCYIGLFWVWFRMLSCKRYRGLNDEYICFSSLKHKHFNYFLQANLQRLTKNKKFNGVCTAFLMKFSLQFIPPFQYFLCKFIVNAMVCKFVQISIVSDKRLNHDLTNFDQELSRQERHGKCYRSPIPTICQIRQ